MAEPIPLSVGHFDAAAASYEGDTTCRLQKDFLDSYLREHAPEYQRQGEGACYNPKKGPVKLSALWDNVTPTCPSADLCSVYEFTIKDPSHALTMLATLSETGTKRSGLISLPTDLTGEGPFMPFPDKPQSSGFYNRNAAKFSNPSLVVLSASYFKAVSR